LKIFPIVNQLRGIIEDIEMSNIIPCRYPLRLSRIEDVIELSKSISKIGLLNPIVVRIKDRAKFEIVAGNRRFEACKMLGLRKIASQIVEIDDKNAYEISLIENIQRKTLDSMEEAQAFKRYVDEFGWGSATELSDKIGKSVSYITKKIRLLDLSPEVLESIDLHNLDTSTAEELLTIKNKSEQNELVKIITSSNMSMKETRDLVRKYKIKHNDIDWLSCPNFGINLEKDVLNYKILNKSIIILRVAMMKLSNILADIEEESDFENINRHQNQISDWAVYEMLLHQKHQLHQQIDNLIRNKQKYERCTNQY
jgi:ParB family chromosome partitioning protein